MASVPKQPQIVATNTDDDDKDEGYLFLIEFAHKHLDFQLPELISVLDMHGIGVVDMTMTTTTTWKPTKPRRKKKGYLLSTREPSMFFAEKLGRCTPRRRRWWTGCGKQLPPYRSQTSSSLDALVE